MAGPTETLAQLGLSTDGPRLIVASGAVIAALGFLLPWSSVVIGSGEYGGYLAMWGLAGPAHPLVALVLVGLAALAMAGERLPRWARPGVPAIAVAGLLLGLCWPYVFSTFGAHAGVWVVIFGAALVAAGGGLDLRAARHPERPSTV